jgi:hypothetical protein
LCHSEAGRAGVVRVIAMAFPLAAPSELVRFTDEQAGTEMAVFYSIQASYMHRVIRALEKALATAARTSGIPAPAGFHRVILSAQLHGQ